MMKTLAIKTSNKQAKTLNLVQRRRNEKLGIQLKNKIEIIFISDILYCQSDTNYTHIFLEDDKRILLSKTLKSVHRVLNESFIRIHQSFLVNIEKVMAVGDEIELKNNIKLPISRSKKQATLDAIKNQYLFI